MRKTLLISLFLVVLSLGCTMTSYEQKNSNVNVISIDNFYASRTTLMPGQNFIIKMKISNEGSFPARNIQPLILGIDEKYITKSPSIIKELSPNNQVVVAWELKAPSNSLPVDVGYTIEPRVYFTYESNAYADVVFTPLGVSELYEASSGGCEKCPVQVNLSSATPYVFDTNEEVKEFTINVDVINQGNGRVSYLGSDNIEDANMNNFIKEIEIHFPSTWKIAYPKNWYSKQGHTSMKLNNEIINLEGSSDLDVRSEIEFNVEFHKEVVSQNLLSIKSFFVKSESNTNCKGDASQGFKINLNGRYLNETHYVSGGVNAGTSSPYSPKGFWFAPLSPDSSTCEASDYELILSVPKDYFNPLNQFLTITRGEEVSGHLRVEEIILNTTTPVMLRGGEKVIMSEYPSEFVDRGVVYQRHRLVMNTLTGFGVRFSRERVNTETIETVKLNMTYGYVIEGKPINIVVKGSGNTY